MKTKKIISHVWMTPATLRTIAMGLWGKNWRETFCTYFEISDSQLHRYMVMYRGQTVPKTIALALDMLVTLKANEIDPPTLDSYRTPIGDVEPVKFVSDKERKSDKSNEGIPEIDMFGDNEPEEIAPPAPEPIPQPEPAETKPAPKPARNRGAPGPKTGTGKAKKPATKPAKKAATANAAKPKAKAKA